MRHLRRIFLKFLSLFTNSRSEAELEREISAHLSLLEDEFLGKGMSSEDARLAARRAYGGVDRAKQLHRDERSYSGVAQTLQDTRYTLRQLRKSKGFTIMAVLMLALGIGSTITIFSIVEAVLLRPLPFPHSDQLVVLSDVLHGAGPSGNGVEAGVTSGDLRNYVRYTRSFSSLGGYFQYMSFQLSGAGDAVEIKAARMSSGVFSALGVAPLLGRIFSPQDDEQRQQVAVLSYSIWKNRFHGDPSILGTKVILSRSPYIVIGVMPRNFEFPLVPGHLNRTELWTPLSLTEEELTTGAGTWHFNMVGRLKPGITVRQAQDDAELVAQETMRNYPASMHSMRISALVRPLHQETVEQVRPLLRTLFLAVTVVLVIACANLAGLMLIRAIRRRREIAVRLALGARPGTLVRQTMLESFVLSLTGGMIGMGAAALALRVSVSLLPETLPQINTIGLDMHVVIFALLLAVATGLICGMVPAFAAIRTNMNDALKEGGRTGTSSGGQARLRSLLVIGQIAVALILLTASGLLLRSFEKTRTVTLGFQPDHVLTGGFGLPDKQYTTQAKVDEFDHELLRRLEQSPGVKEVGVTSLLPASGDNTQGTFVVEGHVPPNGDELNLAWPAQVFGNYFRAMDIRLLRGRLFTEDDTAKSQLVVIVNHKLAEHFWPGQDPIGKRLRRGSSDISSPWLTVIGEVDDVKQAAPDADVLEQTYQPVSQQAAAYGSLASPTMLNGNYGYIVLRTTLPSEQMENMLRETVRSIDGQLPLSRVQTMEQAISDSEAPRWFNTVLISSFALIAVLLAVLGIYSVIAFSVAMREQEMAIRMALGSQRSGILNLILFSGTKLAAVGCVLGLLGAAASSHLLRSFLFEISPFDPIVLILSAVAMLVLTLVASALPAVRAATINPMLSLRGE
jgi:putative ABC transport system permease protein